MILTREDRARLRADNIAPLANLADFPVMSRNALSALRNAGVPTQRYASILDVELLALLDALDEAERTALLAREALEESRSELTGEHEVLHDQIDTALAALKKALP